MMFVVYGVIIFLASGIGAFLGGGSGVIIKPLLTLLVDDTTEVINFISCAPKPRWTLRRCC